MKSKIGKNRYNGLLLKKVNGQLYQIFPLIRILRTNWKYQWTEQGMTYFLFPTSIKNINLKVSSGIKLQIRKQYICSEEKMLFFSLEGFRSHQNNTSKNITFLLFFRQNVLTHPILINDTIFIRANGSFF